MSFATKSTNFSTRVETHAWKPHGEKDAPAPKTAGPRPYPCRACYGGHMKRFEDKVAIVTGGAQGIGRAVVSRLVDEGARVVVADWEADTLAKTCEELGDAVLGVPADVSSKRDVDNVVWTTMREHGKIDLLFNVAGVCRYNLFLEETEENWDANFNVNTKGTFLMGQAVAREMVKQKRGGAIVNTASIASDLVSATTSSYAASKGAIMQLTKVMALELAPWGIRVNAYGPGPMMTRMTAKTRANPERVAMFMKKLVDQRYGKPEEAAAVALFLASDEASFVNGALYYVEGGYRVQ